MNIFEFLGYPADHRKESKITQLVKHFDEVVAKHKKDKKFGVQVKKDGVCSLTVKLPTGAVGIFSRTGKLFTNTQCMVARIKAADIPPGVYMGELLVPKDVASLEEFSGCVNPNRKKPLSLEMSSITQLMELHLFDYITAEDFLAGTCKANFMARHENLCNRVPTADNIYILPYNVYSTEEAIQNAADFVISGGEEGVVIRDLLADWEAGHKGYRVMKLVRGVDYDLVCCGYEEGTGKYKGKVANLLFGWKDGVTIKCMLGKGWTHVDAAAMYQAVVNGDTEYHGYNPIGEIFQVYALEESSKGKLRLAKVGEHRHDKDTSDV